MPPRKKARKNASPAAAAGGRDDISDLPDGMLQHVLSFLPAQDAVRTCVLAKRWRHLWKSTAGLRFVCGGTKEPETLQEIEEFVDHLLFLRISGGTPLDTCEFCLGEDDDMYTSRISLWIRVALQCKVRVLRLKHACFPDLGQHPIFVSQYLKKLELQELDMKHRFLDFSYCPFLEDLEIHRCYLDSASLISSKSLKHLTIREDCCFAYDCRMPICAPNLVSLSLEVADGRTPSLQRMPSLLTAIVEIHGYEPVSLGSDDDSTQSILLQGLSEVRNLVLMSSDTEMFLFRRDLKFCSSFNKLKYLTLNEYWCEPANFSDLACLLKLCPVLEKLTLQIDSWGAKHNVEIKLSCKQLEMQAVISQHLKTVEVKCQVYEENVNNVLAFLSKQLNIWFQFSGQKALQEDGPTIS